MGMRQIDPGHFGGVILPNALGENNRIHFTEVENVICSPNGRF